MSSKNFRSTIPVTTLLTALAFLIAGNAAPQVVQISGAIHTTDSTGQVLNVFNLKTDVYLASGDRGSLGGSCSGKLMPDGEYQFLVTDPSGAVVLSPPGDHRFIVSGGVIVSSTHPTQPDQYCVPGRVVQLAPFDFTPNAGGEYKVWAILASNGDTRTDNFQVRESGPPPPPPPEQTVTISGFKFYDADTDGAWDLPPGEPGIGGWRIDRTPPTPSAFTYTLPSGQYTFSFLFDGARTYTIMETPPPPGWFPIGAWRPTTATFGTVAVSVPGLYAGPNFGNVCLGGGDARTLGFWSNKNGEALFGEDDRLAMVALNLRNADGTDFDPAGYAKFRTWLLNARATNMAYMLSAQLAAMKLNVHNGLVNGAALIYAPGTTSANAAGFATVNAIMAEADAELGLHGLVLAGSPYRAYQEALKNALDNANNNKSFVQPGPGNCPSIPPGY